MNTTKVKTIQNQIKEAIRKIEKDNSVKISFGTCRYSDSDYRSTMSVKLVKVTTDGKKVVGSQSENLELSKLFGFKSNIIGKKFNSNGKEFTITEFKIRNRKYPVIAESNGRSYKFESSRVKTLLAM